MILTIEIKKEFISFRDEARSIQSGIEKKMKEKSSEEIVLDFSRVMFISRSFADELLNVVEKFSKEKKKVSFVNIKPEVKKLLLIVKRTKEKIRSES